MSEASIKDIRGKYKEFDEFPLGHECLIQYGETMSSEWCTSIAWIDNKYEIDEWCPDMGGEYDTHNYWVLSSEAFCSYLDKMQMNSTDLDADRALEFIATYIDSKEILEELEENLYCEELIVLACALSINDKTVIERIAGEYLVLSEIKSDGPNSLSKEIEEEEKSFEITADEVSEILQEIEEYRMLDDDHFYEISTYGRTTYSIRKNNLSKTSRSSVGGSCELFFFTDREAILNALKE